MNADLRCPPRNGTGLERCAAIVRAAATGRPALGKGDIDTATALASEHGMSALLHDELTSGTCNGGWAELRDRLCPEAHRLAARHLAQESETLRICEYLTAREIPFLLLKGAAIARLYYPRAHLRPRSDCDLLVDPMHIAAARRCFEGLGYNCEPLVEPARKGQYLTTQFNATGHTAAGMEMTFDVHWQVSNNLCFARALPFAALYDRAIDMGPPFTGIRCPQLVDNLIIACLHWTTEPHKRLIWLQDLLLLCAALSDQQRRQCGERLGQMSFAAVARICLAKADALFDSSAVKTLLATLDDGRMPPGLVERMLSRETLTPLRTRTAEWLSLRWGERLYMLYVLVFPPSSYLALQGRSGRFLPRLRRFVRDGRRSATPRSR